MAEALKKKAFIAASLCLMLSLAGCGSAGARMAAWLGAYGPAPQQRAGSRKPPHSWKSK